MTERIYISDDDGHEEDITWEAAQAKASDIFGSRKYVYKPEMRGANGYFDGDVTLCYGFKVSLLDLWNAIYPGRRWYRDEKAAKDGSILLLSQEISEPPYEGHEEYTEIHTTYRYFPRETWDGHELNLGDPRRNAETRPPGLKA